MLIDEDRGLVSPFQMESTGPRPRQKSSGSQQQRGSNNSKQNSATNLPKMMTQSDHKNIYLRKIELLLDSFYVTLFMAVITLYALFGDDIRAASVSADQDAGFWVVTLICLSLFFIEWILSSIAKDGYFLSFFFWLDFISTISMLLDVGWINNALFGTGGGNAVNAVQLARAGRASRVGTRAGRIVRVIRLIRLAKLYKAAKNTLEIEANKLMEQEQQEQQQLSDAQNRRQVEARLSQQLIERRQSQQNNDMDSVPSPASIELRAGFKRNSMHQQNQQDQFEDIAAGRRSRTLIRQSSRVVIQKSQTNIKASQSSHPSQKSGQSSQPETINETNIGKQLNELTIKRVITIVLLILISVPLLSLNTYRTDILSYDNGLQEILIWDKYPVYYQSLLQNYINYHTSLREVLVFLKINSTVIYPTTNQYSYESIRSTSLLYYVVTAQDGTTGIAITSTETDDQLSAILSIIRTIFVAVVLSAAAVLFSKDVQDLVLTPVENMLTTVKRISENPLKAANEEEQKAYIAQQQNPLKDKEDENLETVILQKLIVKIGALLAIGFGEAGSEIIAQNMINASTVDPMLPGKKMMAIFGFCDIRNFTDATEVLQQDVMVFVNEIAEIVHSAVDAFCGNANKNIGDAFLLVWKFQESDYVSDSEGNLSLKQYHHIAQIADLAILSFVTIITKVATSQRLLKYKQHEGLSARIPNYSVKMGFGLHCGWAIEGAIGSEYKIDASYLSPNVNMASRLEAATKQFGSWMLVSGQLRDIATRVTQSHLRHIDRVTVKGSIEPIDIYTVDLNLESLNQLKKQLSRVPNEATKKKGNVLKRMKRDKLKKAILKNTVQVSDIWSKDQLIKQSRGIYSAEFYEEWNIGFQAYLKGDWDSAKVSLTHTLTMLKNVRDGPSNTLLRVMNEEAYLRNNWRGYRELTEK